MIMNKLFALLKREVLEHNNIWRVPLILIGIAILLKLSLAIGNLSVDLNVPDQLQMDEMVGSALDGVIAKSLNGVNFMIMVVMFIVAVFYSLACLFNERQDDSVLFWRSLPISDSLTVASKLLIAVVVIPLIVVFCQAVVAVIFFGTDSIQYLVAYYGQSLIHLAMLITWSLLPTVAWCIFCSEIARKNPFLLAFIAPILFVLVDKLFLNGVLSQTFIVNRLTGFADFSVTSLLGGFVFSAVCLFLAVIRRSERI